MSTTPETQALEQRIGKIVQDYIKGKYNADDILSIGIRCGKITMKADAKENFKVGKTTKLYTLKPLTVSTDAGTTELNAEKIAEIAQEWV